MLTSSNLCYPAVSKTGRLCVIVHFEKAKAGYKIVYLSRFAYIFYTRFSSYKNMKGGVARFIHDFPKLDAELGNAEVAHVNSITWLNLRSNLMKMSSKTNGALKDYTRDFFASYKVYTAVNNQEEILIEYRRPMINTGDYLSPMEYVTYHKCKTAEDFFHWIIFTSMRVKQLKAQTEVFAVNADGAYGVSTQAGIRANNTDKIKFSPTIEDYLRHAGKLLSMDDDCFHEEKIALQTEKTKAGTVYNFSEKELEKNMWLLLPATVKVTKFGNEQ